MILWNPAEHADQENLTWCWLRAVEWNAWPAFVSQPIVPLFFLIWPWWVVVVSLIVVNVFWGLFVRYNVVIPTLAEFGVYFVKLKWLTVPLVVVLLIMRGQYQLAVVALFWPWLAGIVGYVPGGLVGKTQKMFMARLGYLYQDGDYSGTGETPEQKLARLEAENAKLRKDLNR